MNVTVTLIVQIFTFALLVWFIMRFLWEPLTGLMQEREKRIADGLAAGEKGRHDLELAEKRAQEVLRGAKQQASDIISHAERRAAEIVDAAKGDAKTEAERVMIAAQSEIDQERNRAREELRRALSELVIAAASKILEKEVDAKAHAKLLDNAVKQL
ncbi:MAG: F0F1 ATP synthase subunit B [Acidiferrobacterales bacterium]|nr:F0F1 ATP synthase subunit B [Acidiferrobacterales bacterium]